LLGPEWTCCPLELHRSRCLCRGDHQVVERSRSPWPNHGGRYVLGLADGQGHHLLLDRLPADEALAKEEKDFAGAIAGVGVLDVVAVPDEVCCFGAPREVDAVVVGPAM
jgi:hypothetical protein